ncbi:MAG: Nif3-like dinuclear metal center hexameric protein [Bacteroidetes bacterium]|nr:MAG: Nif3-like dinuclear metal center hexameric protein [Bacteroidota bacterium]
MKHAEIFEVLEKLAPTTYQESYDNAGLITGSYQTTCKGVLITLDVTEEVVDEALSLGANLIVAHHPLIFHGLKRIIPGNAVTDPLIKAIKNDIAIYAIHTNLDNVAQGVNAKLGQILGLTNLQILAPGHGELSKLVTFVPQSHAEKVRNALFEAGTGELGNYDRCSFNTLGEGTFRANDKATPFVGEKGNIHREKEVRIETLFPSFLTHKVTRALHKAHPYEEVAFDIISLKNRNPEVGAGMIGTLNPPQEAKKFLLSVKEKLNLPCIKYTGNNLQRKIKKVAFCGGSGAFLIAKARSANADIFITGDIKYHDYFEAGQQLIVADIGHYESEQYTKELIFEVLKEKFPTFALSLSSTETNPVKYL